MSGDAFLRSTPEAENHRRISEVDQTNRQNFCEEADSYAQVIAQDESHRVIVCRQNHQWILQQLKGGRWRAIGYFRTRSALSREWTKAGGSALAGIEALPACFSAKKRGHSGVAGF